MPNTLREKKDELFDFDDVFESNPFQFDSVFDIPEPQPAVEDTSLRAQLKKMVEDSGLSDAPEPDLPRPEYGSEVPSSLATAGMDGVDVPMPVLDRAGKTMNPLSMFIEKANQLMRSAPMASQGGALITAAGSTVGDVLAPGLESDKYQQGQGVGETATELTLNTGKSFARVGTALAYLPEALASDPGAVAMGLIKFIPEQTAMIWKAVTPAETKEEIEEQKAAREQLYEDPLGPVFAGLLAGGIAKVGTVATKALRENASKYRIARGFQKNLETARKVAGEMEPPPKIALPPELPPGVAGLLPAPSILGVPVAPKPGPMSRRVPPAPGMNVGFEATAKPTGEAALYLDMPESLRSIGIPPPGNLMTELARIRYRAKEGASGFAEPTMTTKMGAIESIGAADMVRLNRLEPPRPNPMPRSNPAGEPRLKAIQAIYDANPVDVVPDVPITQWNSLDWVGRTKQRVSKAFDFFKTQEKRFKAPESQQLMSQFRSMNDLQHRNLGNMAEDFREVGLLTQREGVVSALQRAVSGIEKMTISEFMQVPRVRDMFVQIGEKFKAMGGQIIGPDGTISPFGLSEEFLKTGPIRLKMDVIKKVWEDVGGIVQSAESVAEQFGASKNSRYIENLIGKMQIERMSFRPETERMIAHLMGDNPGRVKYATTRGQAIKFLSEQASENLFRRYGVERPRLAHYFPEEFIETNPSRVIGRYLNEMSKAMAEIETFGPAREGLNEALKGIQKRAPHEYGYMSDMSDMVMGVIDRTRGVSPQAESLQRWYTNMTYGLKIGGGFAPVVQLTQPLISFTADAGIARSVRAAINVMKPTERAYLRRMGVVGDSVFRKMFGYGSGSKVWDYVPTTKFFNFTNRAFDYMAAETGKLYAQDLYRMANKDVGKYNWRKAAGFEAQVKYAQKKLKEDFGIDYQKPFAESEFIKATQEYAAKSQLHPDVMAEPRFMNLPSTRWLATLKRFTYKQAIQARKMTLGEWRRGNFMPTLRLAAGGYFGGGVMIEAKRKLREAMSGKHVFREQDSFWQDLLNRYAVVGTMGMISDVTFINNEDPSKIGMDIAQNLEFGMTPVALSDAFKAGNIGKEAFVNIGKKLMGTEKQDKDLPWEEIGRRFVEDITTLFGSFGYNASGRLQSDDTESDKNKIVYSRQLSSARRAYWKQDYDKARAIMGEWNDFNDDYLIDGKSKNMGWSSVSDPSFKANFK